ncbi:MAG: DUF255 domain-containing protein [Pirellulales bacterium]|nr:DUF255 domain-containing protein [Pirellulales bacterium]
MNKKVGIFCLLLATSIPPKVGLSQQQIQLEPTLEIAQRLAGQSNRLVMIQFWAQWCVVCGRMDAEVFSQPEVAAVLNQKYVPVKINADHFPATAHRYGITALPTTVIISPDGKLLKTIRGRLETAAYLAVLNRVAAEAEQRRAMTSARIPTGEAAATVQPNVSSTAESSQSASVPTNRYTASQPPDEPAPNMPDPRNHSQSRYAPSHEFFSPPAVNSNVPETQNPRYGNPPPAIGEPSSQAPSGPAYGAQVPQTTAPPQRPADSAYGSQAAPATMPQQQPIAPSNQSPPAMAARHPAAPTDAPAPSFNPPLCLDGYCPVSLCEKQQWIPGDLRWGAIHRGRTYLFSGPEEQRRFFGDPDRFAPVGSGNDIVLAAEQGRAVSGRREHGVFYGNRVYLFSSEESLARFAEKPEVYSSQVLNATRSGTSTGQQLH